MTRPGLNAKFSSALRKDGKAESRIFMTKDKDLNKMAYSLEEVSRLARLNEKTIESWEKELYFLNAGQTGTGKKIFRKKDVQIILRLKDLLDSEGLTLAGAVLARSVLYTSTKRSALKALSETPSGPRVARK